MFLQGKKDIKPIMFQNINLLIRNSFCVLLGLMRWESTPYTPASALMKSQELFPLSQFSATAMWDPPQSVERI